MRVRAEQLRNHLKQGIQSIYFVYGDEPLQVRESTDMIRKAARYYEYEEREVYVADNQFDWQELQYAASEMSLFASKKLIDLHLPTGKPGDKGAQALLQYLENIPEDVILLIHCGKLETALTRTKWFKALDKNAVLVQVWPLKDNQLKQWLVNRLYQQGLQLQSDALQFLFEQVEGNLLSADQEIIKLALLYIEKQAVAEKSNHPLVLDLQQVAHSVSDSSIYNSFDLFDTALKGDTLRVIKMLDTFAAEGQAIAFLLWMITKELRLLASLSNLADQIGVPEALAKTYIFQQRKPLLGKVLNKTLPQPQVSYWQQYILTAAQIDFLVKGVEKGEPWTELKQLMISISRDFSS